MLAREYDRVIAQNRISLEIDPRHPFSRRALGIVYALKGMFPEAEGELRFGIEMAAGETVFIAVGTYPFFRRRRC